MIPLVYLSNGEKFLFKNLLEPDADYVELKEMDTPKAMLQIIGQASSFGALPYLDPNGLRDCQYRAEKKFEEAKRKTWRSWRPAAAKPILRATPVTGCWNIHRSSVSFSWWTGIISASRLRVNSANFNVPQTVWS